MIYIGTDCSGIDAPIHALKQLDIDYTHSWSCEIDKYAQMSIKANSNPEKLYIDITKRNHSDLPKIDIYVCGFPCQPFSLMGLKKGTNDSRSNIMLECIKVIQTNLPNIFILENVKNFKFIENGKPFTYLINTLNNLDEYFIYYDILNTKDYGIPQNRERIYIVGIKKDISLNEFKFPEKIPMKLLEDFILDKTIYKFNRTDKALLKNLNKLKSKKNCIVAPFTFYSPMYNVSPTLTCRCASYYHSLYNRNVNYKECLLLQGFDINFKNVVSNTQMGRQIGNSMSVNVLVELFKEIFKSTTYKNILNIK